MQGAVRKGRRFICQAEEYRENHGVQRDEAASTTREPGDLTEIDSVNGTVANSRDSASERRWAKLAARKQKRDGFATIRAKSWKEPD